MSIDRNALTVTLIYLVAFAVALIAAVDIEPDEFLLEEGGYVSNLTVPFSILFTAVLSLFFDLFENSLYAYIIWFTSAAANSVVLYSVSKRIFAIMRDRPVAEVAARA